MTPGDLVHLYAYQPHDSVLAKNIVHTGILIEYRRSPKPNAGWVVLVDGKPKIFTRTWWKCESVNSVNKEQENV